MRFAARVLSWLHDVLHTDYCPDANRWVDWLKHPLSCLGLVALVALLCGILIDSYSLALFGLLAAIATLGVVWPKIAVAGLRCEVSFQRTRARPGELVPVLLRVQNRWPIPVWGLSLRRGFVSGTRASEGLALDRIPGWSFTEFQWDFRPDHRGCYPTEPPHVDTGFPFGLLHATAPVAVEGGLVVWPASVPLTGMPDSAEIHTREDFLSDRRIGDSGDIVGTRPFRDGDSLRRVHWQQTARYGRLIVTERQAPATCATRFVVDSTRASHAGPAGRETLESVLSIAASIVESLHRQHAFVEAVVGERTFAIGADARDLRRFLDTLAEIPADGTSGIHDTGCLLDRRSRHLPGMTVTTDCGFARHLAHRHGRRQQRYILVHGSTCSHEHGRPIAGCDCRSWIDLGSAESLAVVLPGLWRRACHVA